MAVIEFRSQPVQELDDLKGFREIVKLASSGAVVNKETAMRLAVVYSCVKALSDDLASLPISIMRKKGDRAEKISDHPVQDRLKLSPNPEMRAFTWKKTKTAHALLNGNSYAFIERSYVNPVKYIWPLDPDQTIPVREVTKKGVRGPIKYRVNDGYRERTYNAENILHIKGFSWNGVVGESVITNFAREQIGIGLSLDEFEAVFFRNGLNPGGTFVHPTNLGKNKENFIKAMKKRFGGSKNRGLPMVLEDGMTFEPYQVKMVDQQFLDLLKVNKVDICGMFGVPQSRISISDSNTNYNNSEQEKQRYYASGLMPWVIPDEQEMTLRILTEQERKKGLYVKYNFDAFLRGDSLTRAKVNQIYHRMGVPLNTLLAQDDRNPVEGGDVGLVQINMAPAADLGEIQKSKFSKQPKEEKTKINFSEFRSSDTSEDEQMVKGLVDIEKKFRDKIFRVADKVVNIECDRIEGQIKALWNERSDTDFILWLEEFYRQFPDDLKRNFSPVLNQYADVIRQESARIVGADPALTTDMSKFISEYLDAYAMRHIGASIGQMKGIVSSADPEKLYEELTNRITEWKDSRAGKIADDETIRAANAVAREKWRQLGVTKLKWVTQGSAACPFCKQLSNKIVGIQSAFLEKGDVLAGNDANGNYMRIKGRKNHPPIHKGCVCAIRPLTGTRGLFNEAGASDFVRQRDKLPEDLKAFVTPYSAGEYEKENIRLFLSDSELSGFGLTPENELVSVFSLPGAFQGRLAVEKAVKMGAKTLDCFDTKLVQFYSNFGFKETERYLWNKKYAPAGWDYKKFGEPDLVVMERKEKKSASDYKRDPDRKKVKKGQQGNRGTKDFQDLADRFIEQTFGKDELDKLK